MGPTMHFTCKKPPPQLKLTCVSASGKTCPFAPTGGRIFFGVCVCVFYWLFPFILGIAFHYDTKVVVKLMNS